MNTDKSPGQHRQVPDRHTHTHVTVPKTKIVNSASVVLTVLLPVFVLLLLLFLCCACCFFGFFFLCVFVFGVVLGGGKGEFPSKNSHR